VHGLNPQPLNSLAKVRDWLGASWLEYPALEVSEETKAQGQVEATLDRAGIEYGTFNTLKDEHPRGRRCGIV